MPGMNGEEVSKILVKEFPHLRIAFMTGFTDDILRILGKQETPCTVVLRKPFLPDELINFVKEQLCPS
jgi:CheY-like chemotaxis protein